MRNLSLLDESISLSSTIQLCGDPSVIGSLWQVVDSDSAEVARDVYKHILHEDGKLNIRLAAEGLHQAVRALRDRKMNDPLCSLGVIHTYRYLIILLWNELRPYLSSMSVEQNLKYVCLQLVANGESKAPYIIRIF